MNQVWRDHGKYSVTKLWNQTKNLKTSRLFDMGLKNREIYKIAKEV